MLKYLSNLFVLVITFSAVITPFPASAASLSPALSELLDKNQSSPNDTIISVLVFATPEAETAQKINAFAETSRSLEATRLHAVENLSRQNSALVADLKKSIQAFSPSARFREFWVAPVLQVTLPLSQLPKITRLSAVTSIVDNAPVEYIAPIDEQLPRLNKISAVSTHLSALNIPYLWNRGLRGRGRLVCSFDTGVEGSHPALSSKWRGSKTSYSAAWFAPALTDTIPIDKVGHGTHTMGIMVGNAAADSFGVAPDAEWITAAVIDQGRTLSNTVADIIAAFQWALNPDNNLSTVNDMPDVILNSWGIPTSIFPPCDGTFNQVIDNVEAAGIVTIFAAGNEGPDPMTLRIPANRASSPLNSFAVGALDAANLTIANFSSRGPSSCDNTKIKPEVVAPGVSVYSSYKGGTYRLMSGTSMSAPFIAGLVALMRQYNPNATVAEIKTAIINSCRDLGAAGEDNSYGYGLPDASRILNYLPVPLMPEVYLAGQVISGDGIADPGETFDLFLRLNIPAANVDSLFATIVSLDSRATVINSSSPYFFEPGGSYSINPFAFRLRFDSALINGASMPLALQLTYPFGMGIDTLPLQVTVGRAPNGSMLTHSTAAIQFTVSDFGQFGLGINSIYSAGGEGFKYDGSSNLLYEAGIIIGRSALQLSSSVRDSLARADQSDFMPLTPLTSSTLSSSGGFSSFSRFADSESPIPIPISVNQTVLSFDEAGEEDYLIIKYYLVNNSLENINGLYFGFLTDFDLSPSGDQAGFDSDNGMVYQLGEQTAIGIVSLKAMNGISTLENGSAKFGLTSQQKFDYIKRSGTMINNLVAADFMTLNSFGPYFIRPGDSVEVALALVAGHDLNSLKYSAGRAWGRYLGSTDVNDDTPLLPEQFVLHQNYPNPFNPATTISFDLTRRSEITLSVYNILGQKVTTLLNGSLDAGRHDALWNGCTDRGEAVGSGLYFYVLKTETAVLTRKMMLVK
ncbi:MAG: S8 family serine peptidase [bacterium]